MNQHTHELARLSNLKVDRNFFSDFANLASHGLVQVLATSNSMVKLMIVLQSTAPTSLGENHNICNWSIEHMVINPATLND